ncbi:MAG: cobalt transporter CbiM [Candidatus Methanoperedens sp.]|nr:cobalt transporter CbiM [Candidatus Methanoperedens sp.]
MHIPDSFIPLDQAAIYWIIAIFFIARAVQWAKSGIHENMLPLFGVLAAGIFVLQTINIAANLLIPLPMLTGVSWHVVGAALTAIIFGSPWAAVLLITMVLAVQSLFGDGGITVMGANILNMGIIGGFMGYYSFIGFSKLKLKHPIAMFAGAWISMILPAIALSFELWLAGTFPLKQGVLLMGLFQGIAGIGEGFITIIVFSAIIKSRPDIVNQDSYKKESTASVVAIGIIALLGLALAAPFLASGDPDGLERTAGIVIKENLGSSMTILFSDYSIPGMGKAGEVGAILVGLVFISILWFTITRVVKKG